jgi:hypothetical protein
MSNNSAQPGVAYVFTDREQNYYLIPAEDFARGRVPAERTAEIEAALHDQDVSGYYLAIAAAGAVVGFAAAGAVLAVGAAGGAVVGAAVVGGAWYASSGG